MELTIKQAILGRPTIIKDKEYLSTEAYISPFIDEMSKYTDDFRIQGVTASQMSLTKNGEVNLEDTVFNRIWVQAVIPSELCIEKHNEVVGMIYGLDVRQPIAKIYRGVLNMACTNLCIFQGSFLDIQEIEPMKAIDYKPVKKLMEQTCDVVNKLNYLRNTDVPYNESMINESLGEWVRRSIHYSKTNTGGKYKISVSTAINAYKLLYEKEDSPYFVKKEMDTDMFNIYNAFTQVLTDNTKKDILGIVEKTLLVSDILGI